VKLGSDVTGDDNNSYKLRVIIYLVDSEIRKSRASSHNQNHLIDQHKFRHFDKDLFGSCLHLKYAFTECKVDSYHMSHTLYAILGRNYEYLIHKSNPLIQLGLTLALF